MCGLFLASLSLSCRWSSKTTANQSRHVHCTSPLSEETDHINEGACSFVFGVRAWMQSTEV